MFNELRIVEYNNVDIIQCVAYTVWHTVKDWYDMTDNEHFQKLKLELRRGVLILAVLAELREEHYGYSLRKKLLSKGLEIDESTLYPLIRRLEKQELLTSEWREEDKRKKRFYILSESGKSILQKLTIQWNDVSSVLNNILK